MKLLKRTPIPLVAAVVAAPLLLSLAFVLRESSQLDAAETRTERDQAQINAYLKSVPQQEQIGDESKSILMNGAREWYMLTYPTGRMPSRPWDKARAHVASQVGDAPLWQEPGLRGPGGRVSLQANIPPGTNAWVSYGPRPLDSVGTTNNAWRFGDVGGRISKGGLAIDPNNANVAYAGFAAGGLWKTTNLSAATPTWTPLWDDKDFVTQAAGAIEIDPTNSNTVYVGTGDWAARDQQSAGLMKTTDAGANWTQLGASVFTPYSTTHPAGGNRWDNQNIGVIEVDPNNPSKILVGTRYDLYISHDAGSTWQICSFGANPTDPLASVPATETAINRISSIYLDTRTNPTTAYVAVGYYRRDGNGNNGVYRFAMPASGCPTWPGSFTTLFGGFPVRTGNGTNYTNAAGTVNANGHITGRIELATGFGSDGALTMYAQVSSAANNGVEGTYVLRPDGGSTTWTKLSGSTTWNTCSGAASSTGQDWYDLFLAVDPANDKTLYIGHVDAFKSTVNATYTTVTNSNITNVYSSTCASHGKIHPDQHAFVFVPGTSGSTFLLGNDGGVFKNTNRGDAAAWQQINNSFNTHQFYAGQIGRDFAGAGQGGLQWLFGGMQDNGSSSWKSSQADLRHTGRSLGGDGFFTAFDPIAGSETAGWWMTEYTYGDVACSKNSGADGPFAACGPTQTGTADWSAPFLMDQFHCTATICRNMLFGEDYVHAAGAFTNQRPTWRRVSGNLTRNGTNGTNASIVTVNFAISNPKAAAVGTSDGKMWWTDNLYTGTSCTQAAANTSTFSCTPNTGATWRDVDSANAVLPNRVISGVSFDPTDHTRVYAAVHGFDQNTPGTPGHVFELKWNGSAWTRSNKTGNLPNVPASSIVINPRNRLQAFVGTYFGFYYTDNIDAATPVWVRYQHGLPNTIIKYLTVDRGPAAAPLNSTTLAAFTYGRGVYAIKLPTGGAGFP